MPKKIAIFKAEYPYVCGLCKRQHPIGTRSFFNENHLLIAADCKWPQKAGNTNPMVIQKPAAQAMPPIPTASMAEPKAVEEIIAKRLETAIRIVKMQITDAENYVDYMTMVTEVFHQLGSTQWLELEKRKARL